jgi:hypothetical protein
LKHINSASQIKSALSIKIADLNNCFKDRTKGFDAPRSVLCLLGFEFLTAASCPKKDFYTPLNLPHPQPASPKNVQQTFALHSQKTAKKKDQKRRQKRSDHLSI